MDTTKSTTRGMNREDLINTNTTITRQRISIQPTVLGTKLVGNTHTTKTPYHLHLAWADADAGKSRTNSIAGGRICTNSCRKNTGA